MNNTVSCYDGVIEYKIEDNQKIFERIPFNVPVEMVLANSGITSNTSSLRGYLLKLKEENPLLFENRLSIIREQVKSLKQALKAGELKKVGEIMNENHKILIDMELSHKKLIELCDLACSLGAYGAKVT